MDGVDFQGCDNVEPGLFESEPQATYPGEDVDHGRAGHDGSPSRKTTRRCRSDSVSRVSHCQTTQTCHPRASRSVRFLASLALFALIFWLQ